MMTTTLPLEKLESKDPKVKYGFGKELLRIGADTPGILYPHFDYWVKMTDNANNILKWTAIDIIGYLSSVDTEGKVDKVIRKLFKLLHGGHLITCGHAIFALGMIAKNKPQYKAKIIREFTAISQDTFDTEECKNIATGHVINALKQFPEDIIFNKTALDFINKATNNTRHATQVKAEKLLKQMGL